MSKSTFLLFAIVFLTNCSERPERLKKSELKRVISEWHGKEVVLPDSIFIQSENVFRLVERNPLRSKNLKILSIISGDCSSCINNIEKWIILMDSIKTFSDTELILVVLTSDINQFYKDFFPQLQGCPILYFDVNYNFLKSYNIPDDPILRTFLLDSFNKVILVGNPVSKAEIKKLYFNKIKEYEKK